MVSSLFPPFYSLNTKYRKDKTYHHNSIKWSWHLREVFKKKKKCDICHTCLWPPPHLPHPQPPVTNKKNFFRDPKMHFLKSIFRHFWQRFFFGLPPEMVKYLEKSAKSTKSLLKLKKWLNIRVHPPFSPKNKHV